MYPIRPQYPVQYKFTRPNPCLHYRQQLFHINFITIAITKAFILFSSSKIKRNLQRRTSVKSYKPIITPPKVRLEIKALILVAASKRKHIKIPQVMHVFPKVTIYMPPKLNHQHA